MQAPPLQSVSQPQAIPAATSSLQSDTLLKTLEADSKPDVYSFTVSSIVKCKTEKERRHHIRPIVALLATFTLQMGLLVVLWQAITNGSTTGIPSPEADISQEKLDEKLELLADSIDKTRNDLMVEVKSLRCNVLMKNSLPLTLDSAGSAKDDDSKPSTTSPSVTSDDSVVQALKAAGSYLKIHPHDPSAANLLAFLALVVYVQDEIRRAVLLCYVAAAYTGILPSFYQTNVSAAARPAAILPFWCRVFIAVAPLLQFLTGCMVLLTSLALSFYPETQQTLASIVLTNVALSFILDLDNRIGAMLASQQHIGSLHQKQAATADAPLAHIAHDDSMLGSVAATEALRSQRWHFWGNLCGHCYMSVVGFLLLLLPLLLAPNVAYTVYVGIAELVRDHVDDWWNVALLYTEKHGSGQQHDWLRIAVEPCTVGSCGPTVMRCATFLSTSLVIFLLFSKVLPVFKAERWGHSLLAVQTSLYVVVYFSNISWMRETVRSSLSEPKDDLWWWDSKSLPGAAVLFLWVAAWLAMFVGWPAVHSWQGQKSSCCGAGVVCDVLPLAATVRLDTVRWHTTLDTAAVSKAVPAQLTLEPPPLASG
jgi:hypothetical protein